MGVVATPLQSRLCYVTRSMNMGVVARRCSHVLCYVTRIMNMVTNTPLQRDGGSGCGASGDSSLALCVASAEEELVAVYNGRYVQR